ncbi:MAG TPA: ABC transporter permease [Polyangiaceae bacterium]
MSGGVTRHALWELTKVRLREFLREPAALFWVFGFPLLMAIGLGVAFRSRPPDVPRVAVVAPGAKQPAPGARALLASERVRARSFAGADARRALAAGKVDLVVDWSGEDPVFHFDPTYERGPVARLVVAEIVQTAAGRRDPLTIVERRQTEPGSRYIDFLLPGLIGLNLMGSSMWGVGYNFVLARKRRLLRRYAVTPMRRSHFLLSYFFSRVLFLGLELVVLLGFGALVFGTVVRGSYATVALLAFLGAAAFASVSLVIGARIDSTDVANGWINFVQLPMWVLSGAFFSYERFPEWLHQPIRLLPLTAVVDGMRAVSNAGATLFDVAPQIAVLAVWSGAGFAVALRTFRWQ